jgi:hypothetical protein
VRGRATREAVAGRGTHVFWMLGALSVCAQLGAVWIFIRFLVMREAGEMKSGSDSVTASGVGVSGREYLGVVYVGPYNSLFILGLYKF